MRTSITAALLATLALAASVARGGDGTRRFEATAPQAGFSRRVVADTKPATFKKSETTSPVFATVKVSGEVGEDE